MKPEYRTWWKSWTGFIFWDITWDWDWILVLGMESQKVTTKEWSLRLDGGSPCLGRTSPTPGRQNPCLGGGSPRPDGWSFSSSFLLSFTLVPSVRFALRVDHSFIINVNLRRKQGLSAGVLHPSHTSTPFQRVLRLSDGWCCVSSHTELVVSWSTTCFYLFSCPSEPFCFVNAIEQKEGGNSEVNTGELCFLYLLLLFHSNLSSSSILCPFFINVYVTNG